MFSGSMHLRIVQNYQLTSFFPESCNEEDVLASVQQKGEDYSVLLQQSGTFTSLFLVCVVEVTGKLFSQAPISRPTS